MKNNNIVNIIPIMIYNNMETNKSLILSENKGKSGIYRINNLVRDKSYIGSAIDIYKRLNNYYYISYLENQKCNSIIYKALLKHSYSKFSLDILEYCEPNLLIKREQYYIDSLKPEYNILKVAGSRLGSKHSKEAKAKMSINHIFSPLRKGHTTIIINKKDNSIKTYSSLRSAARSLKVTHQGLIYCIKNNVLLKNTYLVVKRAHDKGLSSVQVTEESISYKQEYKS